MPGRGGNGAVALCHFRIVGAVDLTAQRSDAVGIGRVEQPDAPCRVPYAAQTAGSGREFGMIRAAERDAPIRLFDNHQRHPVPPLPNHRSSERASGMPNECLTPGSLSAVGGGRGTEIFGAIGAQSGASTPKVGFFARTILQMPAQVDQPGSISANSAGAGGAPGRTASNWRSVRRMWRSRITASAVRKSVVTARSRLW